MNKKTKEVILKWHGVSKKVLNEEDKTDEEVNKLNKQIVKSFVKAKNVFCPLCGKKKWLYHGDDDNLWDDYPYVCIKCENAFVIADALGEL